MTETPDWRINSAAAIVWPMLSIVAPTQPTISEGAFTLMLMWRLALGWHSCNLPSDVKKPT